MSAIEVVGFLRCISYATLAHFARHFTRGSQTGTSTALPTIIAALKGDDFVWVGSAYPLAATAFLPASGGASEVRAGNVHDSQAVCVI